jgi:hypothetical protein
MIYSHRSRIGTFHIVQTCRGWMLHLGDEPFDGPFATAQHALDDLAGGHCYWPTEVDTSTLGLPDEIGNWAARAS